jgi:hypothetical protein
VKVHSTAAGIFVANRSLIKFIYNEIFSQRTSLISALLMPLNIRVLLSSPPENIHAIPMYIYYYLSSAEISIKITLKKRERDVDIKSTPTHTCACAHIRRGIDYATYNAYHLFFPSSHLTQTPSLDTLFALHSGLANMYSTVALYTQRSENGE